MNLQKLGDISVVERNEIESGLSGNGVTEPIGVDSNVYSKYNETLLFSSPYSCQSGVLSDDYNKYERLKLRVGWHNNSGTTNEGDSYTEVTPDPTQGSNVGVIWNIGNGTPGYVCVGRVSFPTTKTFNGVDGKLMQFDGNTRNNTWEGRLRPIKEIWGINKKDPYRVTVLDGDHGTAQANPNEGYYGDIVTLSSTPDEGWYSMGYDISGATLSGNQFMFENEDVIVQPLFTDQMVPITYLNDGHGTVTGPDTAIPGQEVDLSTQYNDYYRFNNYEVSGGTITNNKLVATGPCTVKANFKLNSFVASGTFQSNAANGAGKNQYTSITSYCIKKYNTDNVPSSWYDSSNRWKPNGTISGYSMTINGRFQVSAYNSSRNNAGGNWSGCILVGSTRYQNQTGQVKSGATATYSKTQTTSTTNQLYGVSGRLEGGWYTFNSSDNYTNKFVAGSTTGGSWKATGVIK